MALTNIQAHPYILIAIVALGLALRLLHYSSLPAFNETADEFMYPWAGMSLMQTGTPTSWSAIREYENRETVRYWGKRYTLVTPWVHKPPLYPLITGGFMLMTGTSEFHEVRLSALRLVPIALSTLTILLVGIAAKQLFGPLVGLIAALLYATIPTITISGRLSLIENALAPLMVLVLILLHKKPGIAANKASPVLLGIIAATAILLKQIGIAIAIACVAYYIFNKRWKEGTIVATGAIIGGIFYLGFGAWYIGLQEIISIQGSFAEFHTRGLPQLTSILFRYPTLTERWHTFVDPFMLTGYILLFSSPWWLPEIKKGQRLTSYHMLIVIPFTYFLLLMLAQSGGSRFYGWHFFPLFPFVSILLAKAWHTLYVNGTPLQIFSAFLMLSPGLSWLLSLIPSLQPHWQIVMGALAVTVLLVAIGRKKAQQASLAIILLTLVTINIAIIYHAPNLLPAKEQPVSSR